MKTDKYLKLVNEVDEIQRDHSDFYELAEKYGFYTPWSVLEEDVAPNDPVV